MPEIIVGIIIALVVHERSGYSPGGIITAAFVALYSDHWLFVLCTLLVAVATALLVRLFSRWMPLYGRRLFALCVLLGMCISLGLSSATFLQTSGLDMEFAVIGTIIPGLIAKDCCKQGFVPTFAALALAVGLTRLACFAARGWLW